MVEGGFYVWLANSFNTIENITPYRYYDWYITTPTMLITLSIYLIYLKKQEEVKNNSHDKDGNTENNIEKDDGFFITIQKNAKTLLSIIVLNAIMLTFGLLNENHILNKYIAVLLGFVPFIILFYIIYDNYAKYSKLGTTVVIYFSFIWSIYGIAALMPYHWKNIFYNILDLFAKNFFGLYLAYILWITSY
jgi:bacteriorhodopsin